MKNLRMLITALMFVATLVYTITVVSPVLANPPIPDIPCEGFVCEDVNRKCLIIEPSTPAWYCTNLCYVGGRPKCIGQSGCTLACPD
ncbi:MAG: hypothetical protein OHK0041_20830 [Anaerolineales bacterium]